MVKGPEIREFDPDTTETSEPVTPETASKRFDALMEEIYKLDLLPDEEVRIFRELEVVVGVLKDTGQMPEDEADRYLRILQSRGDIG